MGDRSAPFRCHFCCEAGATDAWSHYGFCSGLWHCVQVVLDSNVSNGRIYEFCTCSICKAPAVTCNVLLWRRLGLVPGNFDRRDALPCCLAFMIYHHIKHAHKKCTEMALATMNFACVHKAAVDYG